MGNVRYQPEGLVQLQETALCLYNKKKDKALFNQLKSDLQSKNISWESISIDNKDYDLYFPQKNLCFFVVDEMLYNEKTIDKQYFSELSDKFSKVNINLILTYSAQLNQKYDIYLNRLLYKLNVRAFKKFIGRDCYVKEFPFKEYKEFMNNYHSMGSLVSKIRIGVFLKKTDELLACTCFNIPRYNARDMNMK